MIGQILLCYDYRGGRTRNELCHAFCTETSQRQPTIVTCVSTHCCECVVIAMQNSDVDCNKHILSIFYQYLLSQLLFLYLKGFCINGHLVVKVRMYFKFHVSVVMFQS